MAAPIFGKGRMQDLLIENLRRYRREMDEATREQLKALGYLD